MSLHHPRLPVEGPRHRGTLAAELARGRSMRSTVRRSVAYVQRALQRAYRPGSSTVRLLKH